MAVRLMAIPAADRGLDPGESAKPDNPSAYQREPGETCAAMRTGVQLGRGLVHFHDIFHNIDDLHVPS